MRYIVNTDSPYWCGEEREPRNANGALFMKGDVVEVADPVPDVDGDVSATNLSRPGDGYIDRFIALACLTPAVDEARPICGPCVSVAAVRGALAALGVEADVVAVAQAIDKAKGASA